MWKYINCYFLLLPVLLTVGLYYVLDNFVAARLAGDVALFCRTPYNDDDYDVAHSDPHPLHQIPDDSSKGWNRIVFKYIEKREEMIFAALPTSTCMCCVCPCNRIKHDVSWFTVSDILYW
jgi:hypothetical protein